MFGLMYRVGLFGSNLEPEERSDNASSRMVPLLSYTNIVERLRNYAGQQELFCHDNKRVAKELNELADTIEAGQKAKEEWKI